MWVPAGCGAFLAGTFLSAFLFYRGRAFDPRSAVISDLQSPLDNPLGYGASAVGTAFFAVLITPAVAVFWRQLRRTRPKLAGTGGAAFAIGLVAALGVAASAPFTYDYTPAHILLSSTAFTGISAGTYLHLVAVRASRAFLTFQFGVLLMVIYLCFGPVQFDNSRLLTGLAFWEWLLCADCGVALWWLARAVEKQSVTRSGA